MQKGHTIRKLMLSLATIAYLATREGEHGLRLLEEHTRAAGELEAKGLTGVWVAAGDQIGGLRRLGRYGL